MNPGRGELHHQDYMPLSGWMATRALLLPFPLPPAPGPFWVGFCKPPIFPHRTLPVRTKQSYLLFPGVLGAQRHTENPIPSVS